jgi:hypothetical protein
MKGQNLEAHSTGIDRHCMAVLKNGSRCPGWKCRGENRCLPHSLTPAERSAISVLGGLSGKGRSKARFRNPADVERMAHRLFRSLLDRIRAGCPLEEALRILSLLDDAKRTLHALAKDKHCE